MTPINQLKLAYDRVWFQGARASSLGVYELCEAVADLLALLGKAQDAFAAYRNAATSQIDSFAGLLGYSEIERLDALLEEAEEALGMLEKEEA